ncbi:hypothetical protein ACQKCL_22520, partial [Stutzerimonas stutzeri]
DLSTVAGNKISNPPWVKFQSAGWVNFPSAPTVVTFKQHVGLPSLMALQRLMKSRIVFTSRQLH